MRILLSPIGDMYAKTLSPAPFPTNRSRVEYTFRAVPAINSMIAPRGPGSGKSPLDEAFSKIEEELRRIGLDVTIIDTSELLKDMPTIFEIDREAIRVIDNGFEIRAMEPQEDELLMSEVRNDEVWFKVWREPALRRTYSLMSEEFARRVGERPSLDEIIKEAITRSVRAASKIGKNEVGGHVTIYDMYSNSFEEILVRQPLEFPISALMSEALGVARKINKEAFINMVNRITARRPKLYSLLFVSSPLEAAIVSAPSRGGIKKVAVTLKARLEEHVSYVLKAKEALEGGGEFDIDDIPHGLVTVNPYLSAYLQLVNVPPVNGISPKRAVVGIGVPAITAASASIFDRKRIASISYYRQVEVEKPQGIAGTITLYAGIELRPIP